MQTTITKFTELFETIENQYEKTKILTLINDIINGKREFTDEDLEISFTNIVNYKKSVVENETDIKDTRTTIRKIEQLEPINTGFMF